MTTYNSITSRSEVQALIPEVVSDRINGIAVEKSVALTYFPKVPMGTNQDRMPAVSALPIAYVVSGDTGLRQTSEVNWANKFINAEEIAVEIPIARKVIADMSIDTWGTIEPLIGEAIGRKLDSLIFFGGSDYPGSWGSNIGAGAASGTVLNQETIGTNGASAGGLAADVSDLMTKVETDGFDPNRLVTDRTFRGKLRKLRDTTGQKLLDTGTNGEELDGLPVAYGMRGLWPAATTGNIAAFVGDRDQVLIGVRQDLTYEFSTQGVITDASGLVIYNYWQQGMIGLKVTARYGFLMANQINHSELVEANRWPFGTLLFA